MAMRSDAVPQRPLTVAMWLLLLGTAGGAVLVLGRAEFEGQMFLVASALVTMAAFLYLPKAVAKEPTVTVSFLAVALGAHIVGSLLRYYIIQAVYDGVADANGYYGAGKVLAPAFRSLQIPALPDPFFGTPFVNWTTGLLFALVGTSLLAGFVVHSALAFVGGWFFYRAFRIAFPDGDHKLFALLIFLLPSMWYWPSSLGKDSLTVMGLGVATYGFSLVFKAELVRGLFAAALGTAIAFMVRPPIGAALVVVAAAGFLLRPSRHRAPQVTAVTWLVLVPLLSLAAFAIVQRTETWLGNESAIEAFQAARAEEFGTGETGSNFVPPNPFTPPGFFLAILTVNFRPFPWEAGGLLPALTALEGVIVAGVILLRRRQILRGLRRWRGNGMVILAAGAWVAYSVILSSLPNFGLLARQRTQVLPFLFMLVAMVARPSRRRADEPVAATVAA
jgi:hypothetical protein